MTDLGPVIGDIVDLAGRREVWQLMGDSFGLDGYKALPDGTYPCRHVDVTVKDGQVTIRARQDIGENRGADVDGD